VQRGTLAKADFHFELLADGSLHQLSLFQAHVPNREAMLDFRHTGA